MAHKRNPVAAMLGLAAAQRAPQRVAALLHGMVQEHERALGGWQA
jgi:3-carboxy-cis,cis-muconate cycloisomerase